LGNYIFSGLQTRNFKAVFVGCVAAATLALILDALLGQFSRGLRYRRRGLIVGAGVGVLSLYVYAAGSLAAEMLPKSQRPLVIGAKSFTEQYVLSEILAQSMRDVGGRIVEIRQSLGSTVAFDALTTGQIDAYVDYSGTLWATVFKKKGTAPQRSQVVSEVRGLLSKQYGIRLITTLGFQNAYAPGNAPGPCPKTRGK
jgi:osmoprotectant transport system permease protein